MILMQIGLGIIIGLINILILTFLAQQLADEVGSETIFGWFIFLEALELIFIGEIPQLYLILTL